MLCELLLLTLTAQAAALAPGDVTTDISFINFLALLYNCHPEAKLKDLVCECYISFDSQMFRVAQHDENLDLSLSNDFHIRTLLCKIQLQPLDTAYASVVGSYTQKVSALVICT